MWVSVIEELDVFYDLSKGKIYKYNKETDKYEVMKCEERYSQVFVKK